LVDKWFEENLMADPRKFRVWFLCALLLVAVFGAFVYFGHGLLITMIVGTLVITALVAILARSLTRIALDQKQAKEEVPIILAALGLAIAALWISQGVLATQVNIRLKAKASQSAENDKALVTVSLALENTGVRQTKIKYVSLFVCPGDCPSWTDLFDASKRKLKSVEFRNIDSLGFGPPPDGEFGGNADDNYILTWGTQESRQSAFTMPKADFYDVRFSLGTKEVGTGMVNKWRASSIVLMEDQWIRKDFSKSGRAGESSEQDRPSVEHKSTFELLKKFLGMGGD